jgi:hypothetical protein
MNQQPPPDRRDQLLSDLHEDPASLSLPAQMASRIRHRHRIRTAATSLAVLTIAGLILFHSSRPQSDPTSLAQTSPASPLAAPAATVANLPKANIATDADLMAALEHESVMIFTLADGQRQVVWLDGRPRS